MKASRRILRFFIAVVIVLNVTVACSKKQDRFEAAQRIIDSQLFEKQAADLEKKEKDLAGLRAETEKLMQILKDKELGLVVRNAQLDSIEQKLKTREEQLQQEQENLQNLQATAYIILFIGVVLLVIALFLLFKGRKVTGKQKRKTPDVAKSAAKTDTETKDVLKVSDEKAQKGGKVSTLAKEDKPLQAAEKKEEQAAKKEETKEDSVKSATEKSTEPKKSTRKRTTRTNGAKTTRKRTTKSDSESDEAVKE